MLARPDTFGYRSARFVRRNAWPLAATAMVLVVGAGLAVYHTDRLADERDRAQLEAKKSERVAGFLQSLFAAPDGVNAEPAPEAGLRQGFVEKSNVNSVAEMSRMIEVMRSYQSVASMLQQQNEMRRSAIERLADVPA